MAWQVTQANGPGSPFLLEDPERKRGVLFDNQADSHAAGEAVRGFLGQPRVSEIVAARDRAEADLAEFKGRAGASLSAAEKRAESVEATVAAAARVELARAFEAERKALLEEREQLRDAVVRALRELPSDHLARKELEGAMTP